MRTIGEYLSELKPEIAEKAIDNSSVESLYSNLPSNAIKRVKEGKINETQAALLTAFRFKESPEGSQYWINIVLNINDYLR